MISGAALRLNWFTFNALILEGSFIAAIPLQWFQMQIIYLYNINDKSTYLESVCYIRGLDILNENFGSRPIWKMWGFKTTFFFFFTFPVYCLDFLSINWKSSSFHINPSLMSQWDVEQKFRCLGNVKKNPWIYVYSSAVPMMITCL